MSTEPFAMTPAFHAHVLAQMVQEPDVLRRLRQKADALPEREMRMPPDQGQLMALLVRMTRARRVLEVGTFVGYGTLWMALALPAEGHILTCDIDRRYPAIGEPFWREAGIAERVDLRIAPAIETLDGLLAEGSAGAFDLIFIDADKTSYRAYLDKSLELVRSGGLVLIDNVFWGGKVADGTDQSLETLALRAVTEHLAGRRDLVTATIPIADGLTIVWKPEQS